MTRARIAGDGKEPSDRDFRQTARESRLGPAEAVSMSGLKPFG
jgi:hypothetical protein